MIFGVAKGTPIFTCSLVMKVAVQDLHVLSDLCTAPAGSNPFETQVQEMKKSKLDVGICMYDTSHIYIYICMYVQKYVCIYVYGGYVSKLGMSQNQLDMIQFQIEFLVVKNHKNQ